MPPKQISERWLFRSLTYVHRVVYSDVSLRSTVKVHLGMREHLLIGWLCLLREIYFPPEVDQLSDKLFEMLLEMPTQFWLCAYEFREQLMPESSDRSCKVICFDHSLKITCNN